MEPRLLRRGNDLAALSTEDHQPLQWSHAFSDVETDRTTFGLSSCTELQWSHAFSDVETCNKPTPIAGGDAASMEPRLLRRGNAQTADVPAVPRRASMEPRLLRRGNHSEGFARGRIGRASMEPRLLRRGNRNYCPY